MGIHPQLRFLFFAIIRDRENHEAAILATLISNRSTIGGFSDWRRGRRVCGDRRGGGRRERSFLRVELLQEFSSSARLHDGRHGSRGPGRTVRRTGRAVETPGSWISVQSSLMMPGIASCFQPSSGTHQAWSDVVPGRRRSGPRVGRQGSADGRHRAGRSCAPSLLTAHGSRPDFSWRVAIALAFELRDES